MSNSSGTDNFYLDTRNMDAIIAKVQSIAETMQNLKEEYRGTVTELTEEWQGQSRTEFDKRAAQLMRTMTDISQSFYEIGENLLTASQAYMEQDTANAKQEDGVQNRY